MSISHNENHYTTITSINYSSIIIVLVIICMLWSRFNLCQLNAVKVETERQRERSTDGSINLCSNSPEFVSYLSMYMFL